MANGLNNVFPHGAFRNAESRGDLRMGQALYTIEQQRQARIGWQLVHGVVELCQGCLLYTSPSPRD